MEQRNTRGATIHIAFLACLLCGSSILAQDPPGPDRPAALATAETPDWLTLGASFRTRVEGRTGIGFREGVEDGYGLTRVRLDIGVRPKPWVGFFVQAQDSRAPGKNNATAFFRDPFDLRQAYVDLGDSEKGWVRARAGRQILLYGAQRLIGPLDWGNTARVFDAAKLTLGKKDMSVDIFAASVVVNDPGNFNRRRDGENLHGIYGQLNKLFPKTTFEPYLLWKTSTRVLGEVGPLADADIYTAGFRVVRPLPAGFDVAAEYANQTGSWGGDDVSAWAGYGILGYTCDAVALDPRFSIEYSYATGDSDPTDGKHETFEQLYGTNHLFYGLVDLVGWKNIKNLRSGLELKPHDQLKLQFDLHHFWTASPNDHLYSAGGAIVVRAPDGGSPESFIGREFDITLSYKPKPHVTLGGGYGRLFPGPFIKQSRPGASTSFPFVFVNYVL